MSMNLHLKNAPDLLWQTPTHITYMCMSYNEDGEPDGGMEGVRRRYVLWVKGHADGVWGSEEDLQAVRDQIKAHVKFIESVSDPEFFIM